jgi:quercetin dioxygenase-like cupin family protein
MNYMRTGGLVTLAALTVFALFARHALVAEEQPPSSYQNLLTPVLSGNQTILDQTIAYPGGTPKVTAAIVTLPPGGETGWHTHEIPLFAYILDGELSVDYGDKGAKVYTAGSGLLEAVDWPHNGTNASDVPVRLLAVYIGAEGVATAESVVTPE